MTTKPTDARRDNVDFADVQGLVRFGHGHLEEAVYCLLSITDAGAARAWLRAAPVSTAEASDPLPKTALQVAFTAAGLRTLGVDEAVIERFAEDFVEGMAATHARSRRLGDVGANAPTHWQWGHGDEPAIDLMVMLFAERNGLDAWRRQVEADHWQDAFRVVRELPTFEMGSIEPFGFEDGVSQPRLDWCQLFPTDTHERARYANHLALGEVLLGYPNEYGTYTPRPLLDRGTADPTHLLLPAEDRPGFSDLGKNGTYLVFRQLHQDVRGFWQFLDREAGGDPEERERLATAMVGRTRDGEPLMLEDLAPPGSGPRNRFTFDDDPDGMICPIGAHIRRTNPRTGDLPPHQRGWLNRLLLTLGLKRREGRFDLVASTRFHRLLRRGREYGSPLPLDEALKPGPQDEERGLHFICLVANIQRQFEFVQNAWVAKAKFNGVGTEADPLLGEREPLITGEPTDRFTMPQPSGPPRRIEGLPPFVTVRGGAYFFLPGLRALRFIASERSN
ncbi:MAG: Dyp-type peroxidase [Geminicoccaceae bacterium]